MGNQNWLSLSQCLWRVRLRSQVGVNWGFCSERIRAESPGPASIGVHLDFRFNEWPEVRVHIASPRCLRRVLHEQRLLFLALLAHVALVGFVT